MSSSDSSFSSAFSSAGAASAAAPAAGAPPAAAAAPPEGTEASLAEPSEISCRWCEYCACGEDFADRWLYAYLLDVLARELRDELLETVTLSVDTDGGEDGLDVLGRGLLVAGEVKKEVGCEVLHFECLNARKA